MTENVLNKILARHGISDAHDFMEKNEDANMKRSSIPDVIMRGSVHQMKNMISTRMSVQERFSKLKHL
jgi:hypothetical protein